MNALDLNTSLKSLLTATVEVADPDKPGSTKFVAFPCKIDGSPLGPGDAPIPVFKDRYTGKVYARIAENIPSAADAVSVAAAKAIRDQKPISYVSEDGSVKGFFIEAPTFDASAKVALGPAA
jgi:hypothetical protein